MPTPGALQLKKHLAQGSQSGTQPGNLSVLLTALALNLRIEAMSIQHRHLFVCVNFKLSATKTKIKSFNKLL